MDRIKGETMKVTLLLAMVLLIAGCSPGYWGRFADGMQQQQYRQPVRIYTPQRQNSTYWQETQARQEYYDSLQPDLWKPK